MKGFLIISIIVIIASVLLLLWEPATPMQEAQVQLPPMLSIGGGEAMPAQTATATETQDVRLTDEGFFPAVYRVAAGNPLELSFLFAQPEFITIEDTDVAEYVKASTVTVTFDHPGEYDLTCLSCDDPYVATIVVS